MAVTSNALYMAADNSRIGLALAASILSIVAFLLLLQLYTHLKKASKAISLALQLLNIPIARKLHHPRFDRALANDFPQDSRITIELGA